MKFPIFSGLIAAGRPSGCRFASSAQRHQKIVNVEQSYSQVPPILMNGRNVLFERAAISGKLVLSEFTKNAIARFKAKV